MAVRDRLHGQAHGGAKGYIAPVAGTVARWEAAGWLETATDLRNEFVHRRTYGQRAVEGRGSLRVRDEEHGLFRYFRPISHGAADDDVLDVILNHYEKINELLFACAQASGHDMSVPQFTDSDFIQITKL